MKISLIICSRDRATPLREALESLLALTWVPDGFELVLVDSNSIDETNDVMCGFAAVTPWPTSVVTVLRGGLGIARNAGIQAAQGDLFVFTDDDCFMDPDYFINLMSAFEIGQFQFGAGGVVLHNPEDAPIGVSWFKEQQLIPPGNILTPGIIHGANFFFRREVFEKAGLFREDMGAGAAYPAEDLEMATRASLRGFIGVLLPAAFVRHNHGRRLNTPELEATLRSYERGSGGYYASLMAEGHMSALKVWSERAARVCGSYGQRRFNARLQREFQSASDFLAQWLSDTEEDRSAKVPTLPPRTVKDIVS
jgi:glycosyltransferase involved in cell wall biosynthesis